MLRPRVAVLCAVLAAAIPLCAESQGKQDTPPRVAVVDVSRVFAEYKKTKELNRQMDEKFSVRRDALAKKQQELLERQKVLRADPRSKEDPAYVADVQRWGYDKAVLEKEQRDFLEEVGEFNYTHTRQ
ncbi:MAG TPA: hypothetical protein ENN09_05175, partial [Planctomycetes bacterium]|nr:hypothetical protein [Planctomycetota bacterium]